MTGLLFESDEGERDATGAHVRRCENCLTVMCRTRGLNVLSPDPSDDNSMTKRPITITIDGSRLVLLDSKACLLAWIERQPEETLFGGGYPL